MSSPLARSRNSARAVRKMIGISLVRPSSSSCSATFQPSRPGIITSSRITSGCCSRACSRPDGPSAASITAIRSASRFTRQRRRIGASSSITSTLVTAKPTPVPGFHAVYPCAWVLCAAGGELEREAGALPLGRVDPDPPTHRRHQLLRDEEAEPRAGDAVSRRRFGPVELPEDPLLLGGGDPDPLVDDPHLDRVVLPARPDGDRSALRRVPERVLEEDAEDLAQLLAVRFRGERLLRQVDLEPVPVRRLRRPDHLRDDRADVDQLRL